MTIIIAHPGTTTEAAGATEVETEAEIGIARGGTTVVVVGIDGISMTDLVDTKRMIFAGVGAKMTLEGARHDVIAMTGLLDEEEGVGETGMGVLIDAHQRLKERHPSRKGSAKHPAGMSMLRAMSNTLLCKLSRQVS